jgi:multidrug efflux pump subunit AcrA (membrane-fusion protein)
MRSEPKSWFTRRRTGIGIIVLVVVAAGIGAGITALFTSNSSSATPAITTTTSVQTVATGTITKTVSSSGTVEPAQTADLNFGSSGRVTAVDVTVGQTVTDGQTLATIDNSSLAAALAQAQATLANDQAQLSTDQGNNASSAQIASDQAQIASAEIQVTSAQTSLNNATLTSTIAGTVAAINLTVGQQVSGTGTSSSSTSTGSGASASTGAGSSASSFGAAASDAASSSSTSSSSSSSSAQIEVVSTGSYVVNATVDSSDVSQVKVGDQATLTGTGATAAVYGTVASVGLLATTTSGVSSFPVVIDVTGSPSGLYGGATATVSIITEELQDVIVVPTTAIHYSGDSTTVTLDAKGTKASRAVTIGVASGTDTQVTGGLAVGDKIYVTEISFRGALGSGSRTGAGGLFGGGSGGGGFSGGAGFAGRGGFSGGGGFGG